MRLTEAPNRAWSFRLFRLANLTARSVPDLLAQAEKAGKPLLVHFARASPQARALLRENRVSFLGEDGSCFLFAPPLVVDRELPTDAGGARGGHEATPSLNVRNPFGRNASRVLRWLLLNPREQFSMHAIAEKTGVSETLVSRVVRAMDDEAWIEIEPDPRDRRVRTVQIRRPREALAAWSQSWNRRRFMSESWDIRAEGHDAIRGKLGMARRRRPGLQWAIGGVAGAYRIKRVVEPAGALLWVSALDLDGLAEALRPRRVSAADAQLRIMVAPDDFIFQLAWSDGRLPVADPAQLWLDCHREGERALEAADAIAAEMEW